MDDDELKKNEKLPLEILQQVYGFVKEREDRKIWQLVCRGWYYAANDSARIKLFVWNVGISLVNLAKGLEKYPTFGPKVVFVTTMLRESEVWSDKVDASLYKVLEVCLSLDHICLPPGLLMVLHKYLMTRNSGQTNPLQLKSVWLGYRPDQFCNNDTYAMYLQICYTFRKSITKLQLYLTPVGNVDAVLDQNYGGMIKYVLQFPNLKFYA